MASSIGWRILDRRIRNSFHLSYPYTKRVRGPFPEVFQTFRTFPGPPARSIVLCHPAPDWILFSYISYIHLNYVHYYACRMYMRSSACILTWLLSPTFPPSILSLVLHFGRCHEYAGGPYAHWGHTPCPASDCPHWLPFLGLGTMPNTIIDESTSFIPPSLHIEAFLTS